MRHGWPGSGLLSFLLPSNLPSSLFQILSHYEEKLHIWHLFYLSRFFNPSLFFKLNINSFKIQPLILNHCNIFSYSQGPNYTWIMLVRSYIIQWFVRNNWRRNMLFSWSSLILGNLTTKGLYELFISFLNKEK